MTEPVAMRYDFDGYGYRYIDSGSGSDWQTREKGEFLYTKPFFNQKPVAMMVKMDGFDKPEFTTICGSAALKHPNYTALYDHPMRELSDEEIKQIFRDESGFEIDTCPIAILDFARAIIERCRIINGTDK